MCCVVFFVVFGLVFGGVLRLGRDGWWVRGSGFFCR